MLAKTYLGKSRETGTPFGARLRWLRTQRSMTQKDIADLTGMKVLAVSRLEWSPDANPTLETLKKLAAALGCSVTDLVSEAQPPSQN